MNKTTFILKMLNNCYLLTRDFYTFLTCSVVGRKKSGTSVYFDSILFKVENIPERGKKGVSGELANVSLQPVVTSLQAAVAPTDIVTLFATGVAVSVGIVLIWFGCKWVYGKFIRAVKGGRG